MRVEGVVFAGISVFLFVTDVVYWYLSHDPTGTTALAVSSGLAFVIGYFLLYTARRIPPRPEDRANADVSDGAGDVGFFSPGSYFPIICAGAVSIVGFGVVFGPWLMVIGAVALIGGVVGMLFEYYAGS